MASSTWVVAPPALLVAFLLVGPGWNVLNLRASWDAGPLGLRAGVENVLDEACRTHGSGIDGVGRAAWAAVEAGF